MSEKRESRSIGKRTWAIAAGHIPLRSQGPEPQCTSRDELCLLNTGKRDAAVRLMIYFVDRAPVGPYALSVPSERVRHVRFNDLIDPEPIPLDTPYAAVITADVPIVVQFSRHDTSRAENAIATTLAFPASSG